MAKPKLFTILYPRNDWSTKQTNMYEDQRIGYEAFFELARDEFGMIPIRACKDWYKDGTFDRAWTYQDGEWQKLRGRFRPDLVMDKSILDYDTLEFKQMISERFLTINPWELDMLSSDKLLTSVTFSEISTKTFLVRTAADLAEALSKIKTREVVIKPRMGYGGEGIKICTKAKARKMKLPKLSVVQPMVDTRSGIPGLYKGMHDFRVVIAGEKNITSYIRTPAPGTKLCNISQGGGVIFTPLYKIPKSLQPVLKHIKKTFAIFPHKVYSVDFFFERGKPYLVELNTKPIMMFPAEHIKDQKKMQIAYLEYFESIMK